MSEINFLNHAYPSPIRATEKWNFIDPSKMNEFQTCPRKFFYHYVLGWTSDAVNKHFVFGTAWHLAMEYLSLHGYEYEAQEEAYALFLEYYRRYFGEMSDLDQAPKNPGNAKLAIEEYCDKYRDLDRQLVTLHTEILTSVPIDDKGRMMIGRMDRISEHPSYGIIGYDFKTGSRRSAAWEGQWKTSLQMSYYYHVLNLAFPDRKIYGMMIDGVFFYKRQQKGEATKNVPVRVPVRKTNDMHSAFLSDLNLEVDMLEWNFDGLAKTKEDDEVMTCFPRRTTSCTMYNYLCPFHAMCISWANPLKHCMNPPIGMKVEYWHPGEDETKPKPTETFEGGSFEKGEEHEVY